MARGMVVGEQIVSQANSKAYADGYDRIFGADHKPQRGRWSFGSAERTSRAIDAPVIADRIHEGTVFDDGDRVRDIGSRRKRREFVREKGLEDASDASREWREAQVRDREREDNRKRHEAMEKAKRVLYAQGKWR